MSGTNMPRKIWMLWFQGLEEAPLVVQKCIDSWKRENPTWEVVVLGSENLNDYVNIDVPKDILDKLKLCHQSDLIRLFLLSNYGGVWADATTFCNRPLDEWIDDKSESGFFAFHRPHPDRLISNWFMASTQGCPLVRGLYDRLRLYWMENDFDQPTRIQQLVLGVLYRLLSRSDKTTKHWFNPMITKMLRIYPYCVFHYMFERLIATDTISREIWNRTKKISAAPPHLIKRLGLLSRPNQSIIEQINGREIPVFKLTWKYDHSGYSSDTLLYYLLEEKK